MADVFTDNFSLTLPEIGGSPDTWGNKLNTNFNALDSILRRLAPVGFIGLWSGTVATIPAGWALCDGTNGTPDLRDRFVAGAGGAYTPGDTGGADSVTLTTAQMPAHSHSGSTGSAGGHSHTATTSSAGSHSHSGSTNSTGAHTHGVAYTRPGSAGSLVRISDGTCSQTDTQNTASNGSHSHSLSINSNGAHTHTVTIDSVADHTHTVTVGDTGGGESHENRPPYYALAYIMLLAE